jgi:hypothetical protein
VKAEVWLLFEACKKDTPEKQGPRKAGNRYAQKDPTQL